MNTFCMPQGSGWVCAVCLTFLTHLPIVLYLSAMLFTPETPEVFCGLKHFTHPSIGLVNYPFKAEIPTLQIQIIINSPILVVLIPTVHIYI